jgi:hypothetical protein
MLKFISFLIFVCWATSAHALYFDGGNGDGHAMSLTYSRSWGYGGGVGRGESMILTASQTLVTFSSAATQAFTLGNNSTVASNMTIRQDTTVGSGIATGSDLTITIPSWLAMTFNPISPIGVTGGHIAAAVTYTNGNKTLVLHVDSGFSDGDAVTLDSLQFNNFTVASYGNLLLDVTAGTGASEPDLFDKLILAPERGYGWVGGEGRGESLIDIHQHFRNVIDFGTLF